MRRLLTSLTGFLLVVPVLTGHAVAAPAAVPEETAISRGPVVSELITPVAGQRREVVGFLTSDGTGVPGVPVTLLGRSYGASGFTPLATGTTRADGGVAVSVKLNRSTTVKWVFAGNEAYRPSATGGWVEYAATRVRISGNDLTLGRGQQLVVRGTTFPVQPGKKVRLMCGNIPYPLTQGPAPVLLAQGVVRQDGSIKITKRFPKAGTKQLFVVVPAGKGNAEGYSNYLRVTVRS